MSKAYLNKHENGKSQTLHARERANGAAHFSRVRDYFDEMESAPDQPAPVVVTIPAVTTAQTRAPQPMAQMMLFDQPVTVKAADPEVVTAPAPAPTPIVAPAAAPPTRPLPMLRPRPSNARANAAKPEPFTLAGVIKGCGMGLATAAGLLLAYTLIT